MLNAAAKTILYCMILCSSIIAPAEDVVFHVRVINGKNGRPIHDEKLNVWRDGEKGAESMATDWNGIITITSDSNSKFSFAGNIYVTCHPYRSDEKELRTYSVQTILNEGISDTNMCSKKIRIAAKPGEFIFFERSRSWLEWWKL